MNSLQIKSILRPILGESFGGVFASDLLPSKIDKRPCYLVVNTHDHNREGEHWVGMIVEDEGDGRSNFFDSYGHEPDFLFYPEFFINFLSANSSEIRYNKLQVQDDDSSACGAHVIFFLCQRFKGLSFQEVMRLYSDNLKKNDDYVTKFVKKCAKCVSGVKTAKTSNQKACTLKLFKECYECSK